MSLVCRFLWRSHFPQFVKFTRSFSSAPASNDNDFIPAPPPIPPSKKVPLFNTYRLVEQLKESGLSEKQAVCLMEALIIATTESQEATYQTLATKADVSALKAQLNEKVFNSSLKFDMQQKHLREMFKSELDSMKNDLQAQSRTIESEFSAFKSDIRMNHKTELFALQQQIVRLEKDLGNEKANFKSEQEQMENRMTKYFIGLVIGVGVSLLRLLDFKPSSGRKQQHHDEPE